MKEFILSLQFLFKPSYWIMNNSYDSACDQIMIRLLDNYEFTRITRHTAFLGGHEIWIANHPYASMLPCAITQNARPSRLTIQRGKKKLDEALIKQLIPEAK